MQKPIDQRRLRVRLRFGKAGPARFLGHTDLIRTWERAFRRANLALDYTKGFSPGPQLRFGPPVPVGYEAAGEILEADLVDETPEQSIAARLNDALPAGLSVESCAYIPITKISPMSAARRADYAVTLTSACSDLEERIARFLDMESADLDVVRGKRNRTIDVRAGTIDLSATGNDSLQMRLRLGHGVAVRPDDVARILDVAVDRVRRTAVVYEFPDSAG